MNFRGPRCFCRNIGNLSFLECTGNFSFQKLYPEIPDGTIDFPTVRQAFSSEILPFSVSPQKKFNSPLASEFPTLSNS
ncbi:MAG: hypothetical protein PWP34_1631 [Desulfuromonadales bacterium]|nr:hypothetical protein [Desulfuromonadales bacterium]